MKPHRESRTHRARRSSRAAIGLHRSGCRIQRGSAIVEFPFIVLLLVLLLVVVADFGRITTWAQQVAYSADAGAQFAYQQYDQATLTQKIEDGEFDCAVSGSVCGDIREHVGNAVSALGLDDDDVDIRAFWRCRTPSFASGTMEVRYGAEATSEPNCGADAPPPALFVEVSVTDDFDPFTPFIQSILPTAIARQTFSMRRQIFPGG